MDCLSALFTAPYSVHERLPSHVECGFCFVLIKIICDAGESCLATASRYMIFRWLVSTLQARDSCITWGRPQTTLTTHVRINDGADQINYDAPTPIISASGIANPRRSCLDACLSMWKQNETWQLADDDLGLCPSWTYDGFIRSLQQWSCRLDPCGRSHGRFHYYFVRHCILALYLNKDKRMKCCSMSVWDQQLIDLIQHHLPVFCSILSTWVYGCKSTPEYLVHANITIVLTIIWMVLPPASSSSV